MEITSGMAQIPAADGAMSASLSRPTAGGMYPGVVVVQEAFGLNAHIEDVAARLAREGYATLAPDLYYREQNAVVGYDNLPEAIRLFCNERPFYHAKSARDAWRRLLAFFEKHLKA